MSSRNHRRLLFFAGLFAALLMVAACGKQGSKKINSQDLKKSKTITIGIANEKPYGYEDDQGKPTGEAPTVAKAVLAKMGITNVKAKVVDFGSLIPSLNAGKFDMVAAGMSILPDRVKQALFSDPDYCAQTAFGVKAGNPLHLTDFDSVAKNPKARLGVETGAVEEKFAKAAGIKDSQTQHFSTTADMFDALRAGRVDAVAFTAPTVKAQIQGLGPGFEAAPGFFPKVNGKEVKNCGGFVFRKSDKQFRDEFNQHLDELKKSDGILPLIKQFGFTKADTDAAKNLDVQGALKLAP